MKPIAIFRHASTEGPGYFADYLDSRKLAWRVIEVDQGEPVPKNANEFSGLSFMGGPMSVSDELSWIAPVLHLIQDAVSCDIPVIGHCLGGQLMSKALGGAVSRNPVKEIGWGQVNVESSFAAGRWLDGVEAFEGFHWHGEAFTIPPRATRLLSNRWCHNQAFVLGPHIGMQCHVEMTEDLVRTWVSGGAAEIADSRLSPAVQSPEEIQHRLPGRISATSIVSCAGARQVLR